MRLVMSFTALLLTAWTVLAQAGGSGSGAAGYGTDTKQTGAPAGTGGLAGDWTSFWWILAGVVLIVLVALFLMARRRRP